MSWRSHTFRETLGILRKEKNLKISLTSMQQAVGALGELSDKSDFSLFAWDSFSQEIHDLLLFYCQKSLNLLQMQ